MKNFRAGQIANCVNEWQKLTSDPEILRIVAGDTIKFNNPSLPVKHVAKVCNVSEDTKLAMDREIQNMVSTGIIVKSQSQCDEFVSPIFPVPKPDGTMRIILNLKEFNENVEYLHFKMDSIKVVLSHVTRGCWMASLDLKQAYHSVHIAEDYQKYLKFIWGQELYQYTCYPNGLAPCPRKFTKLTKVPLSWLRERYHIIIGYLDDFFIKGKSKERCRETVIEAVMLLQRLGFTIHPEKSEFDPVTTIMFLGFVIDSIEMTVTLPEEKKEELFHLIEFVLSREQCKIRTIASLVGKMVSSLPASLYGPLYYRTIECDKNSALKQNKGNYEKYMSLSDGSRREITWWRENLKTMNAPIQWPPITEEITTDASGKNGWGASMSGKDMATGGSWDDQEIDLHINVQEMLAVLYALRSYINLLHGKHVRILSDNTTAVFVLNKMGTTRSGECNEMAKTIWQFCMENKMFITCAHIPGKENVIADFESRREYKQAEWMLNRDIFSKAVKFLNFKPEIDCFATRINAQLDCYVSRRPDPYATHIDAFSLNWGQFQAYIFPPFSLINRVLQKIRVDKATALCVLPVWKTQAWWPEMQDMLVSEIFRVQPSPGNLVLPNREQEVHPLHQKLELAICLLSGQSMCREDSQIRW